MQTILIFQQNGSGESKIAGINKFGTKQFKLEIINIDEDIPPLVDDTSDYLPGTIEADLVLDYLKHQDLSDDLSLMCDRLNIPLIASGKKITSGSAKCPPVCCALAEQDGLGDYGKVFGAPKFDIQVEQDRILEIQVHRGAPCGATWLAAQKCKDMPIERALHRFGLEVQFFCSANPANWDPLYGKSPVHLAADIHSGVLKACIKKIRSAINT